MERQNNPKKVRRLNYQVLQDKKERQLDTKAASTVKNIKANDTRIDEIERQLLDLAKQKEQNLANKNQLLAKESNAKRDIKQKIADISEKKVAASLALSQYEDELNQLIEEMKKQSYDTPRMIEVKSRLAYINTEIRESKAKIVEYNKEAKKEKSLKASIEKLRKEEENLNSLIASGVTSIKRNYKEELEVAKKQRADYERQLSVFISDENVEIDILKDLIVLMERETVDLNKEYEGLRSTQADMNTSVNNLESDPRVISLREKVQSHKKDVQSIEEKLTELSAQLSSIVSKELEEAKSQNKEQEYLAIDAGIITCDNSDKTILNSIEKLEKELASLKQTNEKLLARQKDLSDGKSECLNYSVWIKNNRKFSDQMYPPALELAIAECREDRNAATEKVMPQLEDYVKSTHGEELEGLRKKAVDNVSQRVIPLPGSLKEKAINNQFQKLKEYRIKKIVTEIVQSGKSEIWNKAFREIRDNRLKAIQEHYATAEKKFFVDKNNEEAKEAYEQAIQAREMFTKAETDETLIVVKNVRKYFPVEKSFFGKPTRYLKAVDDVSFKVKRGKTLGIVGESGCGKTTMGRTMLRLHEITDGQIIFDGHHIERLKNKEMRPLRTDLQIIFQDPYSSLSPRLPVGEIIGEAVRAHKIVPNSEYKDYIIGVMKSCGLQPHHYSRFPHEFSGGQRQRICIARALAVNPKVVICDEPVSALDVSIQAQIINLLKDLQEKRNLTYIFISHDLSVVEHISDDVGVMYLGSMVESGPKKNIFENPMHPYTEALLSAVPVPDPNIKMQRIFLKGDIPSPSRPPRGCKFHTRCHKCMDICKKMPPVYKEYEEGHFVACHLYPQD